MQPDFDTEPSFPSGIQITYQLTIRFYRVFFSARKATQTDRDRCVWAQYVLAWTDSKILERTCILYIHYVTKAWECTFPVKFHRKLHRKPPYFIQNFMRSVFGVLISNEVSHENHENIIGHLWNWQTSCEVSCDFSQENCTTMCSDIMSTGWDKEILNLLYGLLFAWDFPMFTKSQSAFSKGLVNLPHLLR